MGNAVDGIAIPTLYGRDSVRVWGFEASWLLSAREDGRSFLDIGEDGVVSLALLPEGRWIGSCGHWHWSRFQSARKIQRRGYRMRRWIPIGVLLGAAIVHVFILRKFIDTFLFSLFGCVPLIFIYFGDEIGAFTGDAPTPGILVKIGGWILLLGICATLLTGAPFNPRRL